MQEQVLILGDVKIPIAQKLKNILSQARPATIVMAGSSCDKETLDWLKSFSCPVVAVKGLKQRHALGLSVCETFRLGKLSVGVISGAQVFPWSSPDALFGKALEMGVNILISGMSKKAACFRMEHVVIVQARGSSGDRHVLLGEGSEGFSLLGVKGGRVEVWQYVLGEQSKQAKFERFELGELSAE